MTFGEVLDQVRELLQNKGRVSYRALKLQFHLDDEYLAGLKDELIEAERVAADEGGKVLVWKGSLASEAKESALSIQTLDPRLSDPRPTAAERRQLTVMFCDLVGSTVLSTQLDPEDYHSVVQQYHHTCEAVIQRYDGFVPQHLGDGLLVYFGYPTAHEDDAYRAVRAALDIVEAVQHLSFPTIQLPKPVQVRIGIHTGLVVIGEIGGSEKREMLALGETPNLAARIQGVAEPNTVAMSAVTQRLVQGLFECQALGPQELKGFATPVAVYRAVGESAAQTRFEAEVHKGLTPLVGRELEVGMLRDRWWRATQGAGQVVLLSGEPGIGKSRLVQELKEHVSAEGAKRIEFHCSPYHQNSALYPIIEHLQRFLQFQREEMPQAKLAKLRQALVSYRFPQADTLSLLAVLLSLPQPEGIPPLMLSPQKQKEKTQAALVAWLVEEAERQPVYTIWEDLHWADPSTLEVLTLLLEQAPTTRMLMLLTFRPEFTPPWGSRSYLTQLTLNRLGRSQVEAMVERVASGNALPAEVLQQIVNKTDGVPLFVEELTKTVIESVGATHASPLQLAIPSTLQDSLMARLDRLGPVKEIAQLGAILGREFSYELLCAVANKKDEDNLQQGLRKLVETELIYQHGLPPQATYLFKHALIQDTAYQSLLKSKRQQLHQHIAQVLEAQFSVTKETQPELLAHHYTEAGLIAQAIPYWQQAGQKAVAHSANAEAISHLRKALDLLNALPDTPERAQQELNLQTVLGPALMAAKGYTAPEVGKAYARARELCQQVGETPQLLQVLLGLETHYALQGEFQTARELGEQCLLLAQRLHDPARLLQSHFGLAMALYHLGEFARAREHCEGGIALYHRPKRRSQRALQDTGVACFSYAGLILWSLGYPEQALKRSQEALALARELAYPFSMAVALNWAAWLHQYRREGQLTQARAEAEIALSQEQGFPYWVTIGTLHRGWALAEQGQGEEGITQLRQGLAAPWAQGPCYLVALAEAYGKVGRAAEGLKVLAEALAFVNKTGERYYEAEMHRLKGELLLMQADKLRDRVVE